MRILFLCSSLEPGRDGVGDYTRRLAAALTNLGVEVRIVALHDCHCAGDVPSGTEEQSSDGPRIRVLRLPSGLPWRDRIDRLQTLIDDYLPDWVSFQFVPFGYHPKGLPLGLHLWLASLCGNLRWHIMFHELWVGSVGAISPRQVVLRWLQKRIVRMLGTSLNPSLITSHTDLYLAKLSRMFPNVHKLPLFGNLPDSGSYERGLDILGSVGIGKEASQIGVVFGGVHQAWDPLPFVQKWVRANGVRQPVLLFVGRGYEPKTSHQLLSRRLAPLLKIISLGERASEDVSSILQVCDFAIATTPLILIEKSGSAAACKDFGLPVVVTRETPQCPDVPGFLRASQITGDDILALRRQPQTSLALPGVAALFLQYLEQARR